MAEKTEKVKTALNNSKLSLSSPCPTAHGKFSQLRWDIYMNNPRIIVRTNDPGDEQYNYGMITAAMDSLAFYTFLEFLKMTYESMEEVKYKIENYGNEYVQGQRSNDPVHLTDTWIGKDKDGCVFISVISKKEERPVVKFIFGPGDDRWHKFFHSDGTQYTKAEISVIYARAHYNLLSELMGNVLVANYVPPLPYNSNKQSGSNYHSNKPTNDDITDLPF
jgi:hypothetical protein